MCLHLALIKSSKFLTQDKAVQEVWQKKKKKINAVTLTSFRSTYH